MPTTKSPAVRVYPPIVPFAERLTTLRSETHDSHAEALLTARQRFEVALTEAVSFRAIQALTAITQN